MEIYNKFSTKDNLERRFEFAKITAFSMIDKNYIKSIYYLGTDMERLEKKFKSNDLNDWPGEILIIRTDNDPLAQDDGMFREYYPNAEVYTFHGSGHLTPFVRFEELAQVINEFLHK